MIDSKSENRSGIWRFGEFIPECPPEQYRVNAQDIQSPLVPFCHERTGACELKREDFQPSGSHKERAAVFQISKLNQYGHSAAVVSSSGNAAIALSEYAAASGVSLLAFMSPKTPGEKVARVKTNGAYTFLVSKPVNYANYVSRIFKIPNLKPSRDSNAVLGFMSLGFEIYEQFHKNPPPAIFIFSTSGASCLGLIRALKYMVDEYGEWNCIPQIHAVQSGAATDLAQRFDKESITAFPGKKSGSRVTQSVRAGFGGVRNSPLIPELANLISEARGFAWNISDDDATRMEIAAAAAGLSTSREGCAALAAVHRWRLKGGEGRPLVIFTGRKYLPDPVSSISGYLHPESYPELKKCVEKIVK